MNPSTLAIFDLDGTITRRDTYLAYLFGYALRHPRRAGRMYGLPIDVLKYKLGIHSNTWLKERFLEAVLGGLTRQDVCRWTQTFNNGLRKSGLRSEAIKQLREHQRLGHRVILVTASFDFYVDDLCRHLDIAESICTKALWTADGRLAGRLDGKNCYGGEKVTRLNRVLARHRHQYRVIAYADHHSDLPLLKWADEGVVVSPTIKLARQAQALRIRIVQW